MHVKHEPPAYSAARRPLITSRDYRRLRLRCMKEQPQPDPVPEDEPPPHPAEPLQIDTPVIDMQDLGHVRIEPKMDSADMSDLGKEGEDVLIALEQLEKSLRGSLPG